MNDYGAGTFTLTQQRSIQPRQDVHISRKHVTIFICHRLFSELLESFTCMYIKLYKNMASQAIDPI